jgi:hypothetical protein
MCANSSLFASVELSEPESVSGGPARCGATAHAAIRRGSETPQYPAIRHIDSIGIREVVPSGQCEVQFSAYIDRRSAANGARQSAR